MFHSFKHTAFPINGSTSTAPPLPFFQAKRTINTPGDAHEREADAVADQVMRMKQGDTPIIQQMPLMSVNGASIQAAHKCTHKNPCSAANKKKPYALHWGNDTVCTKFGFPDSNLQLKNPKKGDVANCCNHKPKHVEDYAIKQLQLDGAASCAYANQKKIAEVTYNNTSVRVICADTYPSGEGCNQEIELSQNASAKLNGGTANNLCPIQVTYSTDETLSQHLCYAKKMKGCISDFCKTT